MSAIFEGLRLLCFWKIVITILTLIYSLYNYLFITYIININIFLHFFINTFLVKHFIHFACSKAGAIFIIFPTMCCVMPIMWALSTLIFT